MSNELDALTSLVIEENENNNNKTVKNNKPLLSMALPPNIIYLFLFISFYS
ncbi:hypothetical protein USA300HOU_1950 [Staphylococcus aureus subsp. aureus USA300_TCH1516]|nr:hypothetical protein USA300HOU_1950 [Staphylococcus aureus subsp. aureus USA300_TCH1516]EFT85232.1 hypothetical protein CGSSa03_08250 [Staphylococcus aureus subsp. aureus CGS03]EFU26946.1 hypothetical protein CGSSa01_06392 [Staphylococcus aureus subsp. aureus CGS01]